MRRPTPLAFLALPVCLLPCVPAPGQRHSNFSAPPTAPGMWREPHSLLPPPPPTNSSGLGALQFFSGNYGTAAPQSLTRQLSAEDERTRLSALAALGAPSQYTIRGRVPFARSVQLEFAALSGSGEPDALLTAELDRHLVTAVLSRQDNQWRRLATVVFPIALADPGTTPSSFLRTTPSLVDPTRFRAVFRARESTPDGGYVENEASLRIFNGRAVITASFISAQEQCTTPTPESHTRTCDLVQRWLQPDPTRPGPRFVTLVTATGTINGKDLGSPLASASPFQLAHLRHYICQPFSFSDTTLRYEPAGAPGACKARAH